LEASYWNFSAVSPRKIHRGTQNESALYHDYSRRFSSGGGSARVSHRRVSIRIRRGLYASVPLQ